MKKTNWRKFTAGFNSGYLMAKYCPHLVKRLLAGVKQKFDFLEGIEAGKQEYEQELEQEKLDEIAQIRNGNHDRHRDLER